MKIFWNERGIHPLPLSYHVKIKQALQMIAKNNNQHKNTVLELTFINAEEMRKLNYYNRKKDEPTDVLSFPTEQRGVAKGQNRILGDVVICVDVAEEQAKEYNHSLERELAFLAVHGLLHIFGYDHNSPESEEKMLQAQKEILEKVGLPR